MNQSIKYATAIVVAHLLVNIAHGIAHRELGVGLAPLDSIFVIVVVLIFPLIAMGLLWTAKKRLGLIDCDIRVLASRPLRVREQWATELFGDYNPETMLIRVWMLTAVRKEITSFGTFLSTLCHEFQRFGFADSWHTRGFYERAAALYHHAPGTPPKRLFWVPVAGGRWRIDWARTNSSARREMT